MEHRYGLRKDTVETTIQLSEGALPHARDLLCDLARNVVGYAVIPDQLNEELRIDLAGHQSEFLVKSRVSGHQIAGSYINDVVG